MIQKIFLLNSGGLKGAFIGLAVRTIATRGILDSVRESLAHQIANLNVMVNLVDVLLFLPIETPFSWNCEFGAISFLSVARQQLEARDLNLLPHQGFEIHPREPKM